MTTQDAATHNLSQSGQNLVRILIASYFLAVSLKLIPGTDATALTSALLPEPYAALAGSGIVFIAAYLVLVGAWLRVSALLLATVLFWSSYIQNIGAANLEAFWRDIALIGALILTYTQTLPRAATRRAALRFSPKVRRIAPSRPVAPRRIAQPKPVHKLHLVHNEPRQSEEENIFREDCGIRIAS